MLIALFITWISLPGPLGAIGVQGIGSYTENRALASFPLKSATSLDFRLFTRSFDSYVSDHFGFRSLLIFAVNYSKFQIGVSSNPNVVFGKEGWLFSGGGENIDQYQAQSARNQAAIANWTTLFQERRRWTERLGAHFTLVIAPRS